MITTKFALPDKAITPFDLLAQLPKEKAISIQQLLSVAGLNLPSKLMIQCDAILT